MILSGRAVGIDRYTERASYPLNEEAMEHMSSVTRPIWRMIDRFRDRTAWMLDRTSQVLYRLEERIREERTLDEQHGGR